ncbi:hypothetical protein RCH23_003444 [Cryobacterium sp. CAN_C3]|nr:hypothetical protein [Cryobacterium sp. CAN_C3]
MILQLTERNGIRLPSAEFDELYGQMRVDN